MPIVNGRFLQPWNVPGAKKTGDKTSGAGTGDGTQTTVTKRRQVARKAAGGRGGNAQHAANEKLEAARRELAEAEAVDLSELGKTEVDADSSE